MSKTTTSGRPVEHAPFTAVPLHIPNIHGEPFKTELVEVRSPEKTIKWNFWHLPDDRGDPHNHPWDMVEATIISGGYTEERYWLENGKVKHATMIHRADDINRFSNLIFHAVTEVLPNTVTRMVCGQANPEQEWGYLDIKTGVYTRANKDPNFMARLKANNRFLK